MEAEWRENRWPRLIRPLLRLLNVKSASMGELDVYLDTPRALGRLEVAGPDGQVLYALIDARATRGKAFFLPSGLSDPGFTLRTEDGTVLFTTLEKASGSAPDTRAAPEEAPPADRNAEGAAETRRAADESAAETREGTAGGGPEQGPQPSPETPPA